MLSWAAATPAVTCSGVGCQTLGGLRSRQPWGLRERGRRNGWGLGVAWCRRGGVGSLGALGWAAATLAMTCSGVGCQMLGGLRLTSAVGDGHHRAFRRK